MKIFVSRIENAYLLDWQSVSVCVPQGQVVLTVVLESQTSQHNHHLERQYRRSPIVVEK